MGLCYLCGPLFAGAMAFAELGACSQSTPGSAGPDAGVDGARDAAVEADAGQAEADARCPGLVCNGACTTASDCRSCSGAPLLCAPTGVCMAGCQACSDSRDAALPIGCFACDSNHQNPIGTCQYADAGSYCLSGDYVGQYQGGNGYQCECDAASACPGATQVCVRLGQYEAGFCLTCGESTVGTMQGQPCKDGGACQASQAACQ